MLVQIMLFPDVCATSEKQRSLSSCLVSLLHSNAAASGSVFATVFACVIISCGVCLVSAQSSAQFSRVSPSSHIPLPQQGCIGWCMHSPFSHLSIVQGLKSSQLSGQVISCAVSSSNISSAGLFGSCFSFCTICMFVLSCFVPWEYCNVDFIVYCPGDMSEGIFICAVILLCFLISVVSCLVCTVCCVFAC